MEYMDYSNIEKKFTDYILQLLGPNDELDKQREEKFIFIKNLIINAFERDCPDIKPHVLCFGSFPLKTYLQDSDLDITILFEDKKNSSFLLNYSFDFLNKMLFIIQSSFEAYNNENNGTFSDINLIFADIKLIKCKYGSLSIDISINNFVGLSKIVLMDLVERKISDKLSNPLLFKRTLIMIKAWSYYEGGILGSNISLMANYALEILVIYIFNNFNHLFKTELEAFFVFFKIFKDFNWDSEILHIFGTIHVNNFIEKAKLCEETIITDINTYDSLWYVDKITSSIDNLFSNLIITSAEFSEFVKNYEKFKDIDKTQNFNANKKCINLKYMNIIDPLYNNNNLGKSINFHNFSKIKKVIEFVNNDIENIIQYRNHCDPFKYLNSLLRLFSKSLTANSSEIFFFTLPKPKIIINPNHGYNSLYDESLSKNGVNSKRKYKEHHVSKSNFSSVTTHMIENFNKTFLKNSDIFHSFKKMEETKENIESSNISQEIFVTKEIIEFIIKNTQTEYLFPMYYDISFINEYLITILNI